MNGTAKFRMNIERRICGVDVPVVFHGGQYISDVSNCKPQEGFPPETDHIDPKTAPSPRLIDRCWFGFLEVHLFLPLRLCLVRGCYSLASMLVARPHSSKQLRIGREKRFPNQRFSVNRICNRFRPRPDAPHCQMKSVFTRLCVRSLAAVVANSTSFHVVPLDDEARTHSKTNLPFQSELRFWEPGRVSNAQIIWELTRSEQTDVA